MKDRNIQRRSSQARDNRRSREEVERRVQRLIHTLESESLPDTSPIVRALTNRGEDTDFDVLAKLLDHESPEIRHLAARSIGKQAKSFSQTQHLPFAAQRLYNQRNTKSLLARALHRSEPELAVPLLSAYSILRFEDELELSPIVRSHLSHSDANVRAAALDTIRAFSVDAAGEALREVITLLSDDSPAVRTRAIAVVEWLGPEGDLPQIVSRLAGRVLAEGEEGNKEHRLAAARALVILDPEGTELKKIMNIKRREWLLKSFRELRKEGCSHRQILTTEWGLDHQTPLEEEKVDFKKLEDLRAIKNRMDPENKYIGESLPILGMFQKIHELNTLENQTILLLGPTGAGKTAVAQVIHEGSGRKKGQFRIYQASSSDAGDKGIARSSWVGFGKASGIPGVDRNGSEGLLHECRGGTIFIDELHGLPPSFQLFLLQVLDREPIERAAGGGDPIVPDVRMIFASNRSLDELEKVIQHDLLDRIRRGIVDVPPLRARKDDILEFLRPESRTTEAGDQKEKESRPSREFDDRFLLALLWYEWPGNVRELKDVLEKARARARSGKLLVDHLELRDPSVIEDIGNLPKDQAEKEVWRFVAATLAKQGFTKKQGLQKQMAEVMGVSEPTVSRKFKDYAIDEVIGD